MKRYSTSFVIRKFQITTTRWYYHILIRMALKKTQNWIPIAGEGKEKQRLLFIVGNPKWFWKTVLAVSYKTKHSLIRWSISHASDLKTGAPNCFENYGLTKTCMWMLTTVGFLTTKTWKQPTCPSTGEWWMVTVRYYTAIKKKQAVQDTGES